jgi:hypothetical protein
MITEVSGINAKALCVAAKKAEKKYGKSVEEVLMGLIHETTEDLRAKVEAIRLYYSIIFNSGLALNDLQEESPGELISLN